MRQRRLPILLFIFIGILAMVMFRLYCKGIDQPEKKDKRDQKEAPSKSNTVSVDKPQSQKKAGTSNGAVPGIETTESDQENAGSEEETAALNQKTRAGDEPTFNRNLSKIVYSKHARCRMGCRRIDESEVLEIREEGKVNYSKSELDSKRDPKFALEGVTHDKQHVRIVFAQTSNSHVVVTCIDLDTDWACSCN